MASFEIPLTNTPQTFNITLNNVEYAMTNKWNELSGWVIDIDGYLHGIPLVAGCDLLEPFQYLNFGGSLFVYTDGDATAIPTIDNLGIDSKLYFVTADVS